MASSVPMPTETPNLRRQAAIDLLSRPANRITTQIKRVGIYLRVSTQEQVLGHGIASQNEACATFVNRKNEAGPEQWVIHDIYRDEGESGAKQDRPAIKELEKAVHDGLIDVVVVYAFDRIGRTGKAFWHWVWALQDAGVAIVSVTQNIDSTTNEGKTQLGIYATFAEMEWNAIRSRTQNGRSMKAKEGGWTGGQPPYGYEIVDKGKRNSRLGPCAAEIEVLEKAAEFIVDQGLTANKAAERLNALKHRTRSDKPWTGDNLKAKFFNTALDGFVVFRNTDESANARRTRPTKVDDDGMPIHGPSFIIDTDIIIPLERLYETRANLKSRTRRKTVDQNYYPLSTRIIGECGSHYYGQYLTRSGVRVYRCSGLKNCNDSRIDASEIESAVWDSLANFLGDKEKLRRVAESWMSDVPDYRGVYQERVKELEAEVKAVEEFLSTQVVQLAQANVDPVAIAAATSAMSEKLKEKQKTLAEAQEMMAEAEANAQRSVDVQRLVDNAEFNLHNMVEKDRGEFLELLEIKVTVMGGVPTRSGGPRCPVAQWFEMRGLTTIPEITDELWARMALEAPKSGSTRKNVLDARTAVEAALFKVREDITWAELPSHFPNWNTVRTWVLRHMKTGVWERMLEPLLEVAAGMEQEPEVPLLPPLEITGNLDPRLFTHTDGQVVSINVARQRREETKLVQTSIVSGCASRCAS